MNAQKTHELEVAERLSEIIVLLLLKDAPDEESARENVRDLLHGAFLGMKHRSGAAAEDLPMIRCDRCGNAPSVAVTNLRGSFCQGCAVV